MDSSTSANQRAFAIIDILTKILSHLDNPALFATLLTCKTFFEASTPILYETITIKSIRGPQNPLYRYPHHLKKKIIANQWTKNNSVNLIKRVDLYVHRQSQCPYTVNNTRYNNNPLYKNPLPLPNLKILHLVGGHQQSIAKEEEDQYCDSSTCPFVLKQCMFAEKVIIRHLDFRPLRKMDNLQQVILKIRPCQLPRLLDNSFDSTLISALPSSVKHLKIVWWDEKHSFKVDWLEDEPFEYTTYRWGTTNYTTKHAIKRYKRCVDCDPMQVQGHHRYFNEYTWFATRFLQEKLIKLMELIKQYTSVRIVDIINFDKTGKMALTIRKRPVEDVEVDDLRTKMTEAFIEGESDKGKMDSLITYPNNIDTKTRPVDRSYTSTNDGLDLDFTNQQEGFKVQYLSMSDYYFNPSNRWEIDEEEEEYWKCRLLPSPRLVNYRYELAQDKYNSIEPDVLEFLSVSVLQGEMEDCHKRREVEAKSRSRR